MWIVTSTYIGAIRSLSIPVASLPAVPRSVQGASSVVGLACQGALGSQIPGGETSSQSSVDAIYS